MPRSAIALFLATLLIAVPGAYFAAMNFKGDIEAANRADASQARDERRKARTEASERRRAAAERRAAERRRTNPGQRRAKNNDSAARVGQPATKAPAVTQPPSSWRENLKISLYASMVGGVAILLAGICVPLRRLRHRHTRDYCLYELHLSMHEEAKKQDLEDMVEMIGNVIGGFPEDRAVNGRPFVAFELHYGPVDRGMEWTLAVRCTRADVPAIDAAVSAAYPDVRVGYRFLQDPQPLNGTLRVPGHVLRFRKARDFVYAISTDSDKASSPPIEAIAQAQVSVGTPSSVRIQLIAPGPSVESLARARYRRHENRKQRSATSLDGSRQPSTLDDFELREAMRTQNRGMFWLELQVAAETRAEANQIAAALMARRGDNRLHRRLMVLREPLYRKRFPHAYPPLLPSLSLRSLVSAAEVAHLLELPSARMKGVPVRRLALPRLPAPPEVAVTEDLDVLLPPPR